MVRHQLSGRRLSRSTLIQTTQAAIADTEQRMPFVLLLDIGNWLLMHQNRINLTEANTQPTRCPEIEAFDLSSKH